MVYTRSMLRATVLAAPFGALALSAQAADVASTIQKQEQFTTLAKAIESAGIAQSLQGEGPYTVFAPTDQAFEQLPQGALDELMKEENQDQLKSLLQYHVVEGQEIAAKDAIGKQTDVDMVSGDRLSVDGNGQMVMIVPTGLTVTRVGDQVFVEREVAAVTAPAVEISPAGSDQSAQTQQGQQSGQQSQQQAQGAGSGSSGEQQTAASGQSQQQSGQGDAQTQTAEQSGMPASEHQQQVMANQPSTEQQQTMPQDSGMPSTPHQEQVLKGQQPGEQQGQQATAQGDQQDTGALREAMVVEPDIQADNGVIHAIDAVLVPQSVLSMIEQSGSQGQSGQSNKQQSTDKQG
jgi:uncharacterized surface protein with fasciclin (FAS1) repeats